jgi:hypothetical protein
MYTDLNYKYKLHIQITNKTALLEIKQGCL